MQDNGTGETFLRNHQDHQFKSSDVVTSRMPYLLEERRVRAFEASTHATCPVSCLSDIPGPVYHGIIHKSVEGRRKLEAGGDRCVLACRRSWAIPLVLTTQRPDSSRSCPR